MDDSCAVCAESLQWVAYGACGHREVCSTCVARLRFICGDRRCCICKTDSSVVFVTKAMGDYTRTISDFSIFPSDLREGKVGSFWYHEDTQAFFDDVDHYKMIKAMCRLSCSVCDMEEQSNDGPKRPLKFKNIEQLRGHIFHRHGLIMCSLCLEGRKVFICEQKLYTRKQLSQHISTGDSEVDGSESDRGGFTGHPLCEFCKTPFYGDNELYSHMSTEHYTCHICQRQHPGQFEYYKNYDDLEIHFGREHHLCEDEACLAKKFIVFQTEAEMKRHNTIEHGGRMSRSKRNAALQIPTSFRYRQSSEQDNRRGRRQIFLREPVGADSELSMAIEASLMSAINDSTVQNPTSSTQLHSNNGYTHDIDDIVQPFDSLTTTDAESSARYRQALGQGGRIPMGDTSFPPLGGAPNSNQQTSRPEGIPNNTMAARLRRKGNKKTSVSNSAPAWPAASRGQMQPSNISSQYRPTAATPTTNVLSSTSHNHNNVAGSAVSSYATSAQASATVRPAAQRLASSGTPWNASGNPSRISHSASAPNLAAKQLEPSISDFPPVSATQTRKQPINSQSLPKVEDVHTANKTLVENIRSALEHDEEKFTAFKEISGQFRQGAIDTRRYLDFVRHYGLSHLVLEMARLCPDPRKQQELIENYNSGLKSHGLQGNGSAQSSSHSKDSGSSKKGKGKSILVEHNNSRDALANNIISTVQKLQSANKQSEEEVEVLSKDGYRGKSKVTVEPSYSSQPVLKISGQNDSSSVGGGVGNGNKQRKKTSKFHRVRLGDGSLASLLDARISDPEPDSNPQENGSNGTGVPVRGVWRKGGQKLFP